MRVLCVGLAFLFAFAVFTHPGEVHYGYPPAARSPR